MLELPKKFEINILNRYPEKGKKWLENIDTIVEKYAQKFALSDITLIENLSINLVLFAKSKQFGDVVLKIGAPTPSFLTEINVMKLYSSEYVPKCYFSSVEDRVMILEKLSPGYSLTKLNGLEERIKVFSKISNHLLIPMNNIESFPTLEAKFHKNMEFAYQNKSTFINISEMIDFANEIYAKIKTKNLPKYILHDDLHHKNILKTQNGWKAIDPHGIIGERVFETCQFIRTELENEIFTETKLQKIINLLSQHFEEDEQLILESLYINIVLKIIWYTKTKYDTKIISYNIDVCKKLLNLIT